VGALGDLGERLQRDDVLGIEAGDVGEGGLGLGVPAQVELAAAQDDAGRDVVRVKLQTGAQNAQRPFRVAGLPIRLGQRGEAEALRVLGEAPLEFLDLADGHPRPEAKL
jgi:hypothetical protein